MNGIDKNQLNNLYDNTPDEYGFVIDKKGKLRSTSKFFKNTPHEVVGLWLTNENVDISNPNLDIDKFIQPIV